MFKTIKGRIAAGSALLAVALVAAGVSVAHVDDDETVNGAQEATIQVGTFEYERALENFSEAARFIERVQQLEQEFMRAYEAGNQQRAMEIQMDVQLGQQEVMQSFETKMNQVMPELARDRNLQVIAINVVYHDPEIDPTDITDDLIRRLNELADAESEDGEPEAGEEPAE